MPLPWYRAPSRLDPCLLVSNPFSPFPLPLTSRFRSSYLAALWLPPCRYPTLIPTPAARIAATRRSLDAAKATQEDPIQIFELLGQGAVGVCSAVLQEWGMGLQGLHSLLSPLPLPACLLGICCTRAIPPPSTLFFMTVRSQA